ncbi:MAG: enoyl-CoA hydratase/isomerase family protein [Deltaproteobacteria bacterium]|nr:enoyl-CoA hydratase/isomerase family protein [Deltaproteobacteria bacterium]
MNFNTLSVEKRTDGIGVVTLNRPELRNAISIEMRHEISACLTEWKDDRDIGVVILTGAGPAFTAGFDLKEFKNPDLFDELFASSARYHRDVWTFPKPTIAAVNGPAMAGGFDLAKLCDIRICSESAVFGHPEIKFGVPTLFTPLRWIVGEGAARDLCLTGRTIGADEAFRIGLVSAVVSDERLLQRAIEIGTSILEAPLEALRMTKRFLMDNEGRGMEESFRIEHDEVFQTIIRKRISPPEKKK